MEDEVNAKFFLYNHLILFLGGNGETVAPPALWRWNQIKKLLGRLAFCGHNDLNPNKDIFEGWIDKWYEGYTEARYEEIRDALSQFITENNVQTDKTFP